MRVHVINLDRRPDRLAHVAAQARAQGFAFERIRAVDGQAAELAARAAALPRGFAGNLVGPCALACFESHRLAWARIAGGDAPFGMVLEDDIVLAPGFAALLDPGWVPADADIVRLETVGRRTHLAPRAAVSHGGRGLHRLRGAILGAGAYVLARARAAALLAEGEGVFRDQVDAVLFDPRSPFWPGLVTYQMCPAPAMQGRLVPGCHGATWVQSSLSAERLADIRETRRGFSVRRTRLWGALRRLRQHARALRGATRYAAVPFG